MENFVGTSLPKPEHRHFNILIDMFPDICPNYLRKLCLDKDETDEVLEELASELLMKNYKRVQRPLTEYEVKEAIKNHQMLISLLPDADPVYLKDQVENRIRDINALNQFIDELIKEKKYPLKEEYLRNLELLEGEQKYVKKFDMKYFLQEIPNPEQHFKNRNVPYPENEDYFYAITFLKYKYNFLHVKEIIKIFDIANCSVIQAAKILERKRPATAVNGDTDNCKNQVRCKNIPLLQEIAYVQNKTDILLHIKLQKGGFYYTCECCFNDEVTPYDIVSCESGHNFCSECVNKSCEVITEEGKVDFHCLTACGSQFSLRVLQSVLPQKMFSKMAQRKTLEEVRQAEIDDLAFCPYCDFATILAPEDKIVHCLNEECLKETCRLCKRISHIPFTCEEIESREKEETEKEEREKEEREKEEREKEEGEKEEREKEEIEETEMQDTNNTTNIEEKLTEALVRNEEKYCPSVSRKCWNCSKEFLKESGCNKLTCPCGASMCYVCQCPINGYNHFKGTGGCPVYSDINLLHTRDVRQGAQRAKEDLGNVQLKFDPSQDI